MNSNEQLLTIKEAAERLRVSEVSLRRWTDSGKLPCLRVGGRRERRFREVDLAAFTAGELAGQTAGAGASVPACLHGLSIPQGRHLCAFYDSEEGRDKLAVPFLREGLARNDRCLIVASSEVTRALAAHVDSYALDGEEGRTARNMTIHPPTADPADTLAFFRHEFIVTTRDAARGIRVLGDMAGFIDAGASVADILAFEAEFDRTLAHKYPVISLCQYDARAFSGVAVVRALEVHADISEYPLRYFLGA